MISGIGGLGHRAVQYARAMGLRVCAVDIDDGKWAHATQRSADAAVNAQQGDPIAAVVKITGGGAHDVLITATSLRAFKQALAFAANGRGKADIALQPLSAIKSVFDRLAKGEVPSRVVLDCHCTAKTRA